MNLRKQRQDGRNAGIDGEMEYKDGWDRWRDEMEDGGNGKRDRIEKREFNGGDIVNGQWPLGLREQLV